MQYMIKCTNANRTQSVAFIGPFHSKEAAERWTMLPTGFGFLVRDDDFCDGTHEFVELIAPDHERKFSEMAVFEAIDRALRLQKTRTIEQVARDSGPFVAEYGFGGNPLPVTYENLRDRKISTIKELRDRNKGLGLREAKEIVEGWIEDLKP